MLPLACGHDASPADESLCEHLLARDAGTQTAVRYYVSEGLTSELLCQPCALARAAGELVATRWLCDACMHDLAGDTFEVAKVAGAPSILLREEAMNTTLIETPLPAELGQIVDLSPIESVNHAQWLCLLADGRVCRFDAESGEVKVLATTTVADEPEHEPWAGKCLARRIHASFDGTFAAVVQDFGQRGQVLDLERGAMTMALHGGDYHQETVPFSCAFLRHGPRELLLHRTDWNRLDLSDPSTGELVTPRGPTRYQSGEPQPEHYLDYFHGALYLSPSHQHVLCDGWVWHPVGVAVVFDAGRFAAENVWESEDGPSRRDVCARSYYWNEAFAWLDDRTMAVSGIGDDDDAMVAGARIFDLTQPGRARPGWRRDWSWLLERNAFAGPKGAFFADGGALYSADAQGLSRWDPTTGERTGTLQGFVPTHHHRSARELVRVAEGSLVRPRLSGRQGR